jgi:hypothetical protein
MLHFQIGCSMGHEACLKQVGRDSSARNHDAFGGADAERPHLAACGVAAAWRLGRWGLLGEHLAATRGAAGKLQPDDAWEVRLGEVLAAFHSRRGAASPHHPAVSSDTLSPRFPRICAPLHTRA